ncbi:alpha/beta hydrolase [Nocardia shimofusensis]|uniref:alpha/beta hydrolase n=1 Tax=Nocardia shimofusensis TaxID=228596 RepID=UPI0008332F9A|nr:alpha/beta hydrolase [Nocardia shimofusensis]
MTTTTDQFTVRHGVTIPVTRGGRGRPLVLCPGLLTTQADLRELTHLLRLDFDVMTFDLRGHGLSSAGERYSFDAFLSDFAAVMTELRRLRLPSAPLLVGHSLGADLIVHYAAEHPGDAAELVLIDGANPVPEPFLTEAELPSFHTIWKEAVWANEAARGTPRQILLTTEQIVDLNIELDAIRSGLLDRYQEIDCPIHMLMSSSMAGDSADERAMRYNRNWRAGIERLLRARPHIRTAWLDADHGSVITHAPHIARILRGLRDPAA